MTSGVSIVASARSWIGTRFHHQGRLKKTSTHKGGVDCLGLLVGIARELDLRTSHGIALASLDETDYSHNPDAARLKCRLKNILSETGSIEPGVILLLNIENNPQHLAVVSDGKEGCGLIHAYAPTRAVVEHALDQWWQTHIETAFRIQ